MAEAKSFTGLLIVHTPGGVEIKSSADNTKRCSGSARRVDLPGVTAMPSITAVIKVRCVHCDHDVEAVAFAEKN